MFSFHDPKTSEISRFSKHIFSSIAVMLLMTGLSMTWPSSAQAQGMTQVNIVGLPGVLETPYIDDQRQKFETGQYQVQFTYTNTTNLQAVPFEFHLRITRNGKQLTQLVSNPIEFQPGTHIITDFFNRVTFEKSFDEVINELSSDIQKQVVQGGTLPEGQYVIQITAERADDTQLASATPGIATFMVRFPESPQLVSPGNKSNITVEQPSFSWTPVPYDNPSEINYHFLLVEVYEGQTPLKAIQGNRPFAERTLQNQMVLNYTSEYLPLEEGKQYAWMVTATHVNDEIPIRNDGESQIFTFTYQKEEEEDRPEKISEITLKPGLAKLTDLDQLEWESRNNQYVLRGSANLRLMLTQSVDIPVSVNGLTITKGTQQEPVITGGGVSGKLPKKLPVLSSARQNLALKHILWSLETGLRVSADIKLPDGRTVQSVGGIPGPNGSSTLQLTNAGLSGTLSATSDKGFYQAGDDTLQMSLNTVTVRMPANVRYFSGSLDFFGGDMQCEIQQTALDKNRNSLAYLCNTPIAFSMQQNSAKLQLRFDAINGPIQYNVPNDSLEYDLTANTTVELNVMEQSCGITANLQLSSSAKNQFSGLQPHCSGYTPIAHLGIFRLKISEFNISNINYEGPQNWSFNASVTGSLFMPSIGGFTLPQTTATITSKGLKFSRLQFSEGDLGVDQPFMVGGLGVKPTQITVDSLTFPWFDWNKSDINQGKAGPWSVTMDMDLSFPNVSGKVGPCLTNRTVSINNATFKDGNLSASLSDTPLRNCTLQFSQNNRLVLEKLGGSLSGTVSPDTLDLNPSIELGAHLELGQPFDCPQSDSLDLGDTNLTVTPVGHIMGNIKNLRPTCPLSFGPLQVNINESQLSFSQESGQQQIDYFSQVSVDLLDTEKAAQGSVLVDIDEGRFEDIGLQVDDPFKMGVPREKPALSFRIGSARIDTSGIHINGRHTLLLHPPDTSASQTQQQLTEIGVTFDDVTFDLRSGSLEQGRIIFDKAFAFKLGIDQQTKNLTFEATTPDTVLRSSPAALIKLGSKVIIEPSGLTTEGSANALLNFGAQTYGQDLSIDYSKDFTIGLDPFGIKQGQANFLYNGQRVAYIDRTGFNLTTGAVTTVLPDTLPLPTMKTAFMVIRDNQGNLKLNTQSQQGSQYSLSTTSPLQLHLTALHDSSQGHTPSVNASFSNVVYDIQKQQLVSGSITTNLANPLDLNYLGVPLTLTRIRFAMRQLSTGQTPSLFLEGNLNLFNRSVGQGAQASLFLDNADRIQGSLDLPNLDTEINLLPNSNRARLELDSLGGTVDIPIEAPGVPQFTLDTEGGFWLYSSAGDTLTGSNLDLTINEGGLTIDRFNPDIPLDSAALSFGKVGFELRKLSSLNLSYDRSQQKFNFTVGLDLSFLADLNTGSTMEIPLSGAQISESGFTILSQTINSNISGFNKPRFELGPTTIELREFDLKSDLTFNWFTGEVPSPDFSVDLGLQLSALTNNAPKLQNKWISINNVGYNQGVLTGQLQNMTNFVGGSLPISFGDNAGFSLTEIRGALTNDSTAQNPMQGFDIKLDGRMDMPDFFTGTAQSCQEPKVTLNFDTGWKLYGTFSNYTPCGTLKYGPATIGFNQNNQVNFAFGDTTRKMVLDGGVTATIARPNLSDITATGNVQVALLEGRFVGGSLSVNGPFPLNLPTNNPFLTLTVQQATIDHRGFVMTGDGSINYPNSQDSADINFNQFTIDPVREQVTSGYVDVEDSLAFEVDIGTLQWGLVDPNSTFKADNGARLMTTANFRIDSSGLGLNGSSKGKIRAGGEDFDSLKINYKGFKVKFDPVRVNAGQAEFINVPNVKVGSYDKNGFHLDIEGLAKSVIPDTVALPDRQTAFLVLGDSAGKRADLQTQGGQRTLKTKSGQQVELVMPGFKGNQDTLSVDVTFSLTVDDMFNVTGGSVSLASSAVDLEPYLQLPITLQKLSYKSQNNQLGASITVDLPQSLNNVNIKASALVDSDGFKQATISAGKYRTSYVPSQENVSPIASDSLGNGSLHFYVRGFEAAFGQTKQLKFSGQLKSKVLKDSAGKKTPIHYAANYTNGTWDFNLDAGHVSGNGINLGFGRLNPKAVGSKNESLEVTLNQNEFTVAISGILTFPKMAGDGFSVTMQNLELSTTQPYVDVQAQGNLPDQQFHLFGKIDTVKTTDMQITVNNTVLGVEMDGSLHIYQKSISFQDMVFKTDGTFDIQGGINANLLGKDLEVLPDSSLVFSKVALGYQNKTLDLTVEGSSELPDPLDATSKISITADTDGNVNVSGPQFSFDQNYSIDGGPTEFGIGSFATLEITGLGVDIDMKNPGNTALFATGVVFVSNKESKRIMFGDQANMQRNPGIKYAPNQGVEWNISSNFDPNNSPLSFDYEFFSISISSLQATNNVSVGNQQVPFQVTIGGKTGLNIAGVSGQVGFKNFKFSTRGVDNIGQLTGGSFTLMDIVSLELGTFQYQKAPEGSTVDLTIKNGSTSEQNGKKEPQVDSTTVQVNSYLKFASGSQNNALKISLSSGFSGGIERVLYYKKPDGTLYLSIQNAAVSLSSKASLAASMKYVNAPSGFLLEVAGGGQFATVGIAAVGKISTLNNNLKFGIFVAAQATVPIVPGVVEATQLGGGFFYQPDSDDITMVIDALKGMSSQFELAGPQPKASDLDFAVLLYAGVSIAGSGNNAAISGQTLIQVTDQFTKLDAAVVILNQNNRLEGGMYLTAYYMQKKQGVSGGVNVEVKYNPLLKGTSEVDFYALSKPNNFIWGITGNFELTVIQLLTANGGFIVSNDGMLLELGISKGFDVAIISARASFNLTAWYMPDYTTPLGAFGKFRVSFKVVKGLAEFNAAVKGAYLDRQSYHLLYFAGKAHVKVVGVINGQVQGWVKIQTKSPTVDFGRGKNGKMEQMISDAKQQAQQSKEKAEETRDNLQDAQDAMKQLPGPSAFTIPKAQRKKAGVNMLMGKQLNVSYTGVDAYNNVYGKEQQIYGNVDNSIEGIAKNIFNKSSYSRGYLGIKNAGDPMPDSLDWGTLKSEIQSDISDVNQNAPDVKQRLDEASNELSRISQNMQSSLQSGQITQITSPVSGVQDQPVRDAEGNIQSGPSFQVNESQAGSNTDQINEFDSTLKKLDRQYRDAIASAGANLQLVNQVTSGSSEIQWDSGDKIQVQRNFGDNVSVNEIAWDFAIAKHELHSSYSRMISYFWWRSMWAQHRAAGLSNNENQIKNAAGWGNNWFNNKNLKEVGKLAAKRQESVWKLAENNSKAQNQSNQITNSFNNAAGQSNLSSSNKNALRGTFNQSGRYLWYSVPYLGLEAIESHYVDQATNFVQKFNNKLNSINQTHASFTQSVDRIYTIKAEMMTTLYGMIQEYQAWRNEAIGNPGPPPLTSHMSRLKKELLPPTITKLDVREGSSTDDQTPTDRTYFGNIRMFVNSKHPVNITEISLNISSGSTNSIYNVSDYYTAGVIDVGSIGSWGFGSDDDDDADEPSKKSSMIDKLYPKENESQSERTFTAAVRARGSGGTTIKRLANVTIPVEPEQGTRSGVTITPSDDSSPPTRPVLYHDYPFYKPDNFYSISGTSSYNSYFVSPTLNLGFNITTDSTMLKYFIKSVDKQTGIRKFQYKIGTSIGAGDVRGWTDAQGSRMQGRNYEVQSVGGFFVAVPTNGYSGMNTNIYGLRLQHNKNYYLSFRTVNGAGLKSNVKELNTPILYDATAPERPTLTLQPSTVQRQQPPQSPVVNDLLEQEPQFAASKINHDRSQGSSQRYTYKWSSNDPETGIKGFSFATSHKPDEGSDIFPADDSYFIKKEELTEIDKIRLDYNWPEYVYLRARNHGGIKSATTVYGPYYKIDVTPPTTPGFRVGMSNGQVVIYLTQKSDDDQADVVGYQYAIGQNPGGDKIRSWPDSIQTDFEAPNQYDFPTLTSPPRVQTIDLSGLSQYHGQNLYVSVRSVNRQGMYSRVVSTKNVKPDTTGPSRPAVRAHYGNSNYPKKVMVLNCISNDPETGIDSYSYTLRSEFDQILASGTVNQHNFLIDVPLHEILMYWPVRLEITVENGGGVTRHYDYPVEMHERYEKELRKIEGTHPDEREEFINKIKERERERSEEEEEGEEEREEERMEERIFEDI